MNCRRQEDAPPLDTQQKDPDTQIALFLYHLRNSSVYENLGAHFDMVKYGSCYPPLCHPHRPRPRAPSLPKCRRAVPPDADMFFCVLPCAHTVADQLLGIACAAWRVLSSSTTSTRSDGPLQVNRPNLPPTISGNTTCQVASVLETERISTPEIPMQKYVPQCPRVAPSIYHTVLSHTAYPTSHGGSHVRSLTCALNLLSTPTTHHHVFRLKGAAVIRTDISVCLPTSSVGPMRLFTPQV